MGGFFWPIGSGVLRTCFDDSSKNAQIRLISLNSSNTHLPNNWAMHNEFQLKNCRRAGYMEINGRKGELIVLELRQVTPIAVIAGILSIVGGVDGIASPFFYQCVVSFTGGMVLSGLYFRNRQQSSGVAVVALMFFGFVMMNAHLLTPDDRFQFGAVGLGLLAGLIFERGWRRRSARAQPVPAIE